MAPKRGWIEGVRYLRRTFMSNALVVRSIDLAWTLALEVIGDLACFIGLKFNIAERILLEMDGRVRRRMPRQFRVALTRTASLEALHQRRALKNVLR